MTSKNSLKAEIQRLISELEARGGSKPSEALRAALDSDSDIVVKKPASKTKQPSNSTTTSVPKRAKKSNRKDASQVAYSISEITARLKQAFESDASFEAGVRDLETSGLSKAHVAEIYKEVIGSSKSFPKNATKDELLNALRKDRIMKLRAAS